MSVDSNSPYNKSIQTKMSAWGEKLASLWGTLKSSYKNFKIHRRNPLRGDAPVLFVPTEYFFTSTVELPENFNRENVNDLVRSHLEYVSPFSLSQLFWGFLHDNDARYALVYAAYQERLKAYVGAFESYMHVLPSFFPIYGRTYANPTVAFYLNGTSLFAAYWDPNSRVPSKIKNIKTFETCDHAHVLAEIEAFVKIEQPKNYAVDPGFYELLPPTLTLQNTFIFWEQHTTTARSPRHWSPDVSGHMLWRADIRDEVFCAREQRRRRLANNLWLATVGLICAATMTFIAQATLWGQQWWIRNQQHYYHTQEKIVERIVDEDKLCQRMSQLVEHQLRPFAILEILTQHKPVGVYFMNVHFVDANHVTVEGRAANVNDLNTYKVQLLGAGIFEKIELPAIASKGTASSFTLEGQLKPQWQQMLKRTNKEQEHEKPETVVQ